MHIPLNTHLDRVLNLRLVPPAQHHHVVHKVRLGGKRAGVLLGDLAHKMVLHVLWQKGRALGRGHAKHGQEQLPDDAVDLAGGAP